MDLIVAVDDRPRRQAAVQAAKRNQGLIADEYLSAEGYFSSDNSHQ